MRFNNVLFVRLFSSYPLLKLRRSRLLGPFIGFIARTVLPSGKKVRFRVESGLGKGLILELDPRYSRPFSRGDHEYSIQVALWSRLKPGDSFFDIGSHIGFFSLLAARRVGPQGRVFAFEPDPDNVNRLLKHRELNKCPQLEIVEALVWSSSEVLAFDRPYELSGGSTGSVKSDPVNRILIPSVTLDDFVGSRPTPRLIKIDVEGGELNVLRGSATLLAKHSPALIIEAHDFESHKAIEAWLSERNYMSLVMSEVNGYPKHLLARSTKDKDPIRWSSDEVT